MAGAELEEKSDLSGFILRGSVRRQACKESSQFA